ncbi:hypothetical protein Taro_014293 [Colocasia esculenta]|uniref:Retrotransposon gag domain-containing protein n=1 Tax=Colocasia esculenta TaxID=4460 RepID=A0A843U8N5_COLES|nr:hypothetical protein [Colocasia esculenta]
MVTRVNHKFHDQVVSTQCLKYKAKRSSSVDTRSGSVDTKDSFQKTFWPIWDSVSTLDQLVSTLDQLPETFWVKLGQCVDTRLGSVDTRDLPRKPSGLFWNSVSTLVQVVSTLEALPEQKHMVKSQQTQQGKKMSFLWSIHRSLATKNSSTQPQQVLKLVPKSSLLVAGRLKQDRGASFLWPAKERKVGVSPSSASRGSITSAIKTLPWVQVRPWRSPPLHLLAVFFVFLFGQPGQLEGQRSKQGSTNNHHANEGAKTIFGEPPERLHRNGGAERNIYSSALAIMVGPLLLARFPICTQPKESAQSSSQADNEEMEGLVRRLLAESLSLSKPHSLQNYCKLPNAYFPSGFKAPKYCKYDGTSDPQFHLAGFTMDSHRWLYDRILLVHLFQQSLEGEALRWLTSLPASDLVNFDIVSECFISHFSDMAT